MSDEEEQPAEVEPPKRKPKLILIIAAAGGLVVILAAVAGFLLLGKKKPPEDPKAAHVASAPLGDHIDTPDENAARAAALARAAADSDLPSAANVPPPAIAEPLAKP